MVASSKSLFHSWRSKWCFYACYCRARGVRPYGCWIYATLLGQRQTFDARLEISSRTTPNRHQDELVFGSFPEDKSLCVVHYLRHYEKRTHALRGAEAKLFYKLESPTLRCLEGHTTTMDKDGSKDCWHWYVKVHCPFDTVSIDQLSRPQIAVGYYLEDCGLEVPEYIRYFLQEANMRRKCLSACCTLPKLRMCLLMILCVGCVY